MPDVFEIDVSGSDVFDRNFSVAVVYNNTKRFGFYFHKNLQESINQ